MKKNNKKTKHKKGVKFDDKKPAMAYLPPLAMLEVGYPFLVGKNKYGAFNFMQGLSATRCVGGALRHIFQFMAGEDYDKESSEMLGRPVHHLACAVANLLMALENVIRDKTQDDRYKKQ